MLRKLLGAVLTAAMVFAVGTGAFGADVYYTGGGGGGGGGANSGGGAGAAGDGGGRVVGESDANQGNIGGTGGSLGSNGTDGGKGSSLGNTTEGNSASGGGRLASGNGATHGGQGGGGANLDRGSDPYGVDLDTVAAGSTDHMHILGGNGGEGGEGTNSDYQNGGSGGVGGDVRVRLTGADTVDFDIEIAGGNGGTGGLNTVGGTDEDSPGSGHYQGSHGSGGRGGDVVVTAGDLIATGDIAVAGGDAGDARDATDRNGGRGGNASFTAGTITLTNGASIVVKNGAGATTVGRLSPSNPVAPVGGNATVKIDTLSAGAGGGKLDLTGGVDATVTGNGTRLITIDTINAKAGDFALDLTTYNATAAKDMLNITTINVGDDAATSAVMRKFEVDGGTVLSKANGWSGTLNTFGTVTLGGLDLSGANVTADVSAITTGGFDITGATIITKGTNALTVDADTKVDLKINAAQKADLLAADANLQVIDASATDISTLDGQNLSIWNGAEEAVTTFNAAGGVDQADAAALVFVTNAGAGGAAYNAMLAAPALMSLVNTGADAVEKAAGSFSPMSFMNSGSGVQFGMFASMGAASIDVDTGSGVDSDSFHMLIGPGLRVNNGTGKTDFGAFFEAGWGGYDAYSGVYRGEGDTEYYGGGLILRHDTCFGLYGEASLRMGAADTDYHNRDGLDTDYDMGGSYVGGHLGLGCILRPSERSSLDFFAKGILTHVSDESAKDKAGNTITVDDTDSFRTQLGAKYSYNFGRNASFFVKGAWEHEFDGETGGSYNAARIAKNADTSGSSVIGELGVDVRVAERVSLGASVYGIAGQRKGFGGNVTLGIGF